MTRLRGAVAAATACAALLGAMGAAATVGAAGAEAATTASGFYINGAGYGHGVGMSQYGALGFAQHGFSYRAILSHYYRNTSLAQVSPTRLVTVLLKNGTAAFRGANRINAGKVIAEPVQKPVKKQVKKHGKQQGKKQVKKPVKKPALKPVELKPGTTYSVLSSKGQLKLVAGGREIAVIRPPLAVSGAGPVTLLGVGSYHGQLQFRPRPKGGVQTINAVDLEDYVRGVVPSEMPSTWPMQALEAQAVAARTYAIAVAPANPLFDVYSDTRSQVYGGVGAQTPAADAAEAATRGQVVEYAGQPVTTYFFSSSGGYTESVQNVFLGVAPEAWLIGVPDPYDDSGGNPYYRWHVTLSLAAASRALGKLVKGNLEGIKVLQQGVSPRVVRAAVVGTKGATDVSGPRLRRAFNLRSTYMSFMTIRTKSVTSKTPAAPSQSGAAGKPKAGGTTTAKTGTTRTATRTSTTRTTTKTTRTATTRTSTRTSTTKTGTRTSTRTSTTRTATTRTGTTETVTTPSVPSSGGGGLSAHAHPGPKVHHELQGSTFPAVAGQAVVAERLVTGGWIRAGRGRLTAEGSYDIPVAAPGLYRVSYRGVDGPAVSVK